MEHFYQKLPKIELHAHLNGSLSNRALVELRELKYGTDRTGESDDGFYKILNGQLLSLEECFQKFRYAHDLTDRRESLELATRRVIEEFARDNVVYLELRTTPKSTGNMSKREYLITVLDVLRNVPQNQPGILVKLLPSIDRSKGVLEGEENVTLAIELAALYPGLIVGLDLSGNPFGTKFADFVPSLRRAREHGFRLALHCGEIDDDQEVKEMFELGVDRIGHGTFITGENLDLAARYRIPFECCLTSNVKCKTVPSYEDHHFGKLLELQQPVCICTDDFGVFETSLSRELEICAKTFSLSHKQVLDLQQKAIDYTFVSNDEKEQLRAVLQEFETQMIKAF
ncbi:adenosine deaminase-like protein [Anopheles darlingi]|uniref:adenosine deaminase-like protein n=1 Tax=Anopheles darlingi TaxID=43151 RepID=UPI0021006573|nr:adenosine deaminase-like protein [Anopheles darlingi]